MQSTNESNYPSTRCPNTEEQGKARCNFPSTPATLTCCSLGKTLLGVGRTQPDLNQIYPFSESVKCRFSKCHLSVLNLKFDFISFRWWGQRRKTNPKSLGSLPPCGNRCRFSESAICSSRVHPPSEIKSNLKFKTLRWRPLRWRLTLSDFRPVRVLYVPLKTHDFKGTNSFWP